MNIQGLDWHSSLPSIRHCLLPPSRPLLSQFALLPPSLPPYSRGVSPTAASGALPWRRRADGVLGSPRLPRGRVRGLVGRRSVVSRLHALSAAAVVAAVAAPAGQPAAVARGRQAGLPLLLPRLLPVAGGAAAAPALLARLVSRSWFFTHVDMCGLLFVLFFDSMRR